MEESRRRLAGGGCRDGAWWAEAWWLSKGLEGAVNVNQKDDGPDPGQSSCPCTPQSSRHPGKGEPGNKWEWKPKPQRKEESTSRHVLPHVQAVFTKY